MKLILYIMFTAVFAIGLPPMILSALSSPSQGFSVIELLIAAGFCAIGFPAISRFASFLEKTEPTNLIFDKKIIFRDIIICVILEVVFLYLFLTYLPYVSSKFANATVIAMIASFVLLPILTSVGFCIASLLSPQLTKYAKLRHLIILGFLLWVITASISFTMMGAISKSSFLGIMIRPLVLAVSIYLGWWFSLQIKVNSK